MNRNEMLSWLQEEDPDRLASLWRLADDIRRKYVGEEVHLRGLIEFSNCCRSNCRYCGMRRGRGSLPRYRMSREEILASAEEAASRGYGAVVLQSGEDPALDVGWLAGIIKTIKRSMPLAVALSCGEHGRRTLSRLREAGADRYYLRFETSDRDLWRQIHPSGVHGSMHRIDLLPYLQSLGYETGSGVMVGIPGQTWESLAEDIEWFRRLDLDMIGCGTYVPHPDTPLGRIHSGRVPPTPQPCQVPNTNLVTYKVMALTRLVCPRANIPTTTALETIDPAHGYLLGLQRGANAQMINLTPVQYRGLYEIYPAKAGISESPQSQRDRVGNLLSILGRVAGGGPGTSLNYEARRQAVAFPVAR
jgi:biotin synthase